MDIENAAGLMLNNKYELLAPIGQGGKSIVYKARDLENNRIVACKILLPELIDDELNLKRFRQEAVAAKRLDHLNINSVSDFGEFNGQPYMIMQFLDGLPLSDLIANEDKLSIERSIPIFIQIATGCAYAHTRSIIHRDLKPSNIVLIEKNNQKDFVQIIDFGIAKIISENTMAGTKLTKTGDIFGSPLYMSPEQCMGKTADLRTDIYSLGALMYEALTGEPPFEGETALVTIFKHIREMPAKFTQLNTNPKISQMIENIVFKCLAKEPKQRYQSMEEIIEAYKKILPLINASPEQ
jgi:serine/threonine protein kinase